MKTMEIQDFPMSAALYGNPMDAIREHLRGKRLQFDPQRTQTSSSEVWVALIWTGIF